jgi:hypothetical protein
VASFKPLPFYPQGKGPQYPLVRRLPQSQPRNCEEVRKKIHKISVFGTCPLYIYISLIIPAFTLLWSEGVDFLLIFNYLII